MPDIKNIADRADVIVNGYAFTCEDNGIHQRPLSGNVSPLVAI